MAQPVDLAVVGVRVAAEILLVAGAALPGDHQLELVARGALDRMGGMAVDAHRALLVLLFQRELAIARNAMFESGMTRVQALAGQAVSTLVALMGRQAPPAVRLGAARTVAELAIQQHQAEAIIGRLEELEKHQRGEIDR